MELDVTVLDMLPSDEEVLLYPCACTCTRSTDQTQTRPTVG
ncbi:ALQxL family class IV lanthipeptide [Nonomuraea sp. NPDC050790]